MKKILAIFLIASAFVFGRTYNVKQDGTGDFISIQPAITTAAADDEVVVHRGTYFESISLKGKRIVLRSLDPTDPDTVLNTIIDGTGQVDSLIRCTLSETRQTVISGFVITNASLSLNKGGALYCWIDSNPTITNCVFINNSAGFGGAIYSDSSKPLIRNCSFYNNDADYGGAIGTETSAFQYSPEIENCSFDNNTAVYGGAIQCTGNSPVVKNSSFSSNSARFNGGAVFCIFGSHISISDCLFSKNSSDLNDEGGGLYSDQNSIPMVQDSIFCTNIPDQIFGSYSDQGNNVLHDNYCPPPKPVIEGDLDGDGDVDIADFSKFAENWLVGVL